jgi:hypothetical protein
VSGLLKSKATDAGSDTEFIFRLSDNTALLFHPCQGRGNTIDASAAAKLQPGRIA